MARTQTKNKPARKAATTRRAAAKTASREGFHAHLFDARPDRLDLRDRAYRPPLRSLPEQFPDDAALAELLPAYVEAGLVLDQGQEGACTGFGLACVANYLLFRRERDKPARERRDFVSVSPRMLYELARRYDEWPGEQYEGSSCRGAIKGWHKHGVCSAEHWPYRLGAGKKAVFVAPRENWAEDAVTRTLGVYYRVARESVVDLQAAIADIGAVYVSAQVHDGWSALQSAKATAAPRTHADLPRIGAPKKRERGGHAFALVGFNRDGFIVQNSWGARWGAGGFALLPYEDWIAHATDAWACALGVPAQPSASRLAAQRWPVASGQALSQLARGTQNPRNPADDPWPIDRIFLHAPYEPWSTAQAYAHTLVTDNDGEILVRDLTRASDDVQGYVAERVVDAPLRGGGRGPLKLAVYAHGGLNAEAESIRRIRMLGPCFAANGIHPLFLTWKTGPGETLRDVIADVAKRIAGADDARHAGSLADELGEMRDRAVEVAARLFARGVWSEMRENARRSRDAGHGLDVLARQLVALNLAARAAGRGLELHLIGHSAGSILLGHLLERLLRSDLRGSAPRIAGVHLYAAACSMRFAVKHYLGAADQNLLALNRLWLWQLSDTNEKADGLPSPRAAVYGKSLLYLVSRALDETRKQPLLGMERALLGKYVHTDYWAGSELDSLRQWQARWPLACGQTLSEPMLRTTRTGERTPATHGAFDNAIEVLGKTLERIRNAPLVAPLEWFDY